MERKRIETSETANELFNNKTFNLLFTVGSGLISVGIAVGIAALWTEKQEVIVASGTTGAAGAVIINAALFRDIAVDLYRRKNIKESNMNGPTNHDTP